MYDAIIVGCGVVGAATAFELSRYDLSVLVLEKENDVSCGTSKANSGILHAGYDPHHGSLMAKLNIEGARLARDLCLKLDVPYRQCGSLVLAFSEEDEATLQDLFERGSANGVTGLELWDSDQARSREPSLNPEVTGALFAPSAAIVSPWEYTLALAETAVKNGAQLHLNAEVTAIDKTQNGFRLHTDQQVYDCRYVVNAAGVHADKIHNMVSEPLFSIIPDRGEYYLLDKSEGSAVNHVIFQCPTKVGKGALVSPTVHGNLIVGPNNELPDDVEDTATTPHGLKNVREMAQRSVPSVNLRANIRTFSGVRAMSDIDDFIISIAEDAPGFIDLAGIKSPGLTAAPAIAKMAASLLEECGAALQEKGSFVESRKKLRFAGLNIGEKQRLVEANPAYGRVICRCETITEGEILDTFLTPIPPRSVEGVKRRCNAGMGRCQGGFCSPRIVELLARMWNVSPLDIPLDRKGSTILVKETKGAHTNG